MAARRAWVVSAQKCMTAAKKRGAATQLRRFHRIIGAVQDNPERGFGDNTDNVAGFAGIF